MPPRVLPLVRMSTAAAVLAALSVSPPAAAVGCVVLPSGECADEPPRLLGGWVADERLAGGPRVVVVPTPTPGRVTVELRLDRPLVDLRDSDRVIAELLGSGTGDPAGEGRGLRRDGLGARTHLELAPGALILRTDGPADALPALIELEAERLARFAPTADAVERAVDAVTTSARRRASAPDAQLVDLAVGVAPLSAVPPTPEELRARVASTWWGPSTTLIIAGDVEVDAVADRVRALWAAIPAPTPDVAPLVFEGVAPADLVVAGSRATRTRVALSWPLPIALDGSRRGAVAELLRELLVGPGTPLHRALGADALRIWSPETPGSLVLAVELAPGADPDAVLQAARRVAADLSRAGADTLTPAVERARLHLVQRATVELQDAHGWAHAAGRVMASGAPPEGIDRRVDVLRTVPVDDVRQAAAELLGPGPHRTVVLLPTPEAP
ncbi:MAG: insulinase family protein [Alphaproteobacteria bacterium]|nr:insulinase family protein [Alphaproteobacteria bacterium]